MWLYVCLDREKPVFRGECRPSNSQYLTAPLSQLRHHGVCPFLPPGDRGESLCGVPEGDTDGVSLPHISFHCPPCSGKTTGNEACSDRARPWGLPSPF